MSLKCLHYDERGGLCEPFPVGEDQDITVDPGCGTWSYQGRGVHRIGQDARVPEDGEGNRVYFGPAMVIDDQNRAHQEAVARLLAEMQADTMRQVPVDP